jgi:hypothetical protein
MSENEGTRPKAVLRPSMRDKRRNRRRKSKYNRPLFSVAHFLALALVGLGFAFVLALIRATQLGDDLALQSVDTQRLSDLNLPGVPQDQGGLRAGARPLQIVIWAYLFGTPILFALQRLMFWRSTRTGVKNVVYAAVAVWVLVISVIGVSSI